ncbi:MAG: phage shock protein operon transcriptional activator [Xanthomonadales bacterium]|nr:phage shock protein operon transcriptional activator [Xanthomonadales bacterium]
MSERTSRSAEGYGLIGESPCFTEVLDQVSRLAALNRPALVIGERGTGKELIAARLHYLSPRWDRPLVKLNCAALAETLLETELFGHEAGAFTGANRRHIGRFELSHEGSLFLDELASSSLRVQEKILRVIEYGEFERVGGRETVRVDSRLIAAANVDLPALAQNGRFREDLLDRLAFDVVTLPPLRARQEDIQLLAEHFATRMAAELGHDCFAGFSSAALEQLQTHPWPGNVRELKNVVERAVYRNPDPDKAVCEISLDPFASPFRPGAVPAPAAGSSPIRRSESADPVMTIATDDCLPLTDRVRQIEIAEIESALEACRHNQRKAAEKLGLTYHQLRGYLRKYQIGKDEEG